MTTITVSSAAALKDAYATLASNGGGTILLDEGADIYGVDLVGKAGATDPITITSANLNDPVELTELRLAFVENVVVKNVVVDTSEIPGTETGENFLVGASSNVVIKDSTFNGRASDFYDRSLSEAEQSDIFGNIKNSANVTFEGNVVSNYNHGLGIFESTGVDVVGNDISGIQSDGIRMAGVQDVDILNNNLHDFYGSPNSVNHDDMIQLWSKGAKLVTQDLTISGNFLNSGSGVASQSIFIGNERDFNDPSHTYKNITVTDNVIYNGHTNGIVVSGAKGALIGNNTLLYNSDAKMYSNAADYLQGDGTTGAPAIRFARIEDGQITGNIASSVSKSTSTYSSTDNQIVSFTNENSVNFVGKHFVNATSGGAVDNYDLQLREDSAWVGQVGASGSQPITQTTAGTEAVMSLTTAPDDMWTMELDASFSIDEKGALNDAEYDFVWTFEDGSVLEGMRVSKMADAPGAQSVQLDILKNGKVVDSIERTITLEDKELALLDFENGVDDLSSYDSGLNNASESNLVDTDTGAGYQIGGSSKLELGRSNDQIHNLETFGITLKMEALNPDNGGTFLSFHKVMSATLSKEGAITFKLETNEGDYRLTTEEGLFQDGKMHTLGIGFDGHNGALEMTYDGETVASMKAYGVTAGKASHGLVIGNTFYSSMEAVVESFHLNADPSSAGVVVEKAPRTDPEKDTDVINEEPANKPDQEPQEQDGQGTDSQPSPKSDTDGKSAADDDKPLIVKRVVPEKTDSEEAKDPSDDQSEDEGGSFISKIFSVLLSILIPGYGKDDESETADASEDDTDATSLADIIPITEMLSENALEQETDLDEVWDLSA